MTEEEILLIRLGKIPSDEGISELGFECMGKIGDIYPELPTEDLDNFYRSWIWINTDMLRIVTWDFGNGVCEFMCEGSLDGLKKYIEDYKKEHSEAI